MEKYQAGNLSENEDDPEVYESSGDEWNEEVEEKKRGNRRTSQRLSKKPRVSHVELSSDSEAGDGTKKPKSKNGIKRPKLDLDSEDAEADADPDADADADDADADAAVDEDEDEEEEEEEDSDGNGSPKAMSVNRNNAKRAPAPGSKISASDFVNGGFLILKKDAELGESGKPCLWRIDGKALLQKYEPVEEEGQVRHKNTSIYTGWSSLDKDMYHPVTVKVLQHQGQNMTVELNWEKLKELSNESE